MSERFFAHSLRAPAAVTSAALSVGDGGSSWRRKFGCNFACKKKKKKMFSTHSHLNTHTRT
jgi:hypothetical protein